MEQNYELKTEIEKCKQQERIEETIKNKQTERISHLISLPFS